MAGQNLDTMTEMFANRFVPDANGYQFRANLRSPTYACTTEERDRLVDEFARRSRWLVWGVGGLTVLTILGLVIGFMHFTGQAPSRTVTYGVFIVWIGPFVWINSRLWNAPVRAFAGRTPTAPALSAEDARKQALARLSWLQLASGLPLVAYFAWRAYASGSPFHGWAVLYTVIACGFVALLAVQAIRKLLASR